MRVCSREREGEMEVGIRHLNKTKNHDVFAHTWRTTTTTTTTRGGDVENDKIYSIKKCENEQHCIFMIHQVLMNEFDDEVSICKHTIKILLLCLQQLVFISLFNSLNLK